MLLWFNTNKTYIKLRNCGSRRKNGCWRFMVLEKNNINKVSFTFRCPADPNSNDSGERVVQAILIECKIGGAESSKSINSKVHYVDVHHLVSSLLTLCNIWHFINLRQAAKVRNFTINLRSIECDDYSLFIVQIVGESWQLVTQLIILQPLCDERVKLLQWTKQWLELIILTSSTLSSSQLRTFSRDVLKISTEEKLFCIQSAKSIREHKTFLIRSTSTDRNWFQIEKLWCAVFVVDERELFRL